MSSTLHIDGDVFLYRVGFGQEGKGEENALACLDEILYGLINEANCDYHILYVSGEKNFRKVLYPQYKANRKPKPELYQCLRDHMVNVWAATVCDNMEADDGISLAMNDSEEHTNISVSIDKDLQMIPGKHLHPLTYERHEVSSAQALRNFYTQMLTGDRVDNIPPAIKGKTGPKTAEKMLAECMSEADLYSVVKQTYNDENRMRLQAQLLWLLSTTRTNMILGKHEHS